MSPFLVLKHSMDKLTKKEAAIAEYILEDINRIVDESSVDIVKNANSSKSAFSRMCQKIGFEGYVDFRYACVTYIEQHRDVDLDEETDYTIKITNSYVKRIEEFLAQLDRETLKLVSQLILNSNRIRSYGFRASSHICQQLYLRALELNLEIIPFPNEFSLLATLPILKNDDLVLYFAVDANSPTHQGLLNDLRDAKCKKVLITTSNLPSKINIFDYSIVLPSRHVSANNFYLDNQAIFLIFLEILTETVSENMDIN